MTSQSNTKSIMNNKSSTGKLTPIDLD